MAAPQTAWGIDVGRAALKAVKLRATAEGSIELLAADLIEHAQILTQPDANRPELINAALEKFLSRNDISKDRVVVSVPGQQTLARFTKLPPVAPRRIPDIVRYEADQQIPFDMDEVIWDYQTFQQEGLPDIEVGIFAMKRELLREHLLYFEQASIEPVAVQTTPLAAYNVAHFADLLSEQTTVILDIGSENTDLVIATRNSLWTRTIPIGGNRFTDSLVKSFKLSFAKAEGLKRTAETSKYRRQIFQAMRPVFSDLVQELQRSIGFYSSTHRDAEIDKVVGVGAAIQLPGLAKYLSQNLGLSIDVPKDFSNVNRFTEVEVVREQPPAFATATGLALQGLEKTKVASNLLPTEIAKQIVWRRKKPAFAAAAACLVAAGGIIWFRQTADMSALAAAQTEAPRPSNVEQASRVVDSGPNPSLSDWGKAAEVFAAGDLLRKELGQLRGQGVQERTLAEQLVQLQENKLLVPKILQTIHAAVPRPDGPLENVSSGEALVSVIEKEQIPRSQRDLLTITSMDMQYYDDLHLFVWPSSLVATPPAINPVDTVLPGFWVKITCRTPRSEGAKFIDQRFLTPLREAGRQPGAGFYFDRVYLVDGRKLETELKPASAGGAAGRVRVDETLFFDPVTGESRLEDWEFVIWAEAAIGDYPFAEEEEDGTEDTSDEQGGD